MPAGDLERPCTRRRALALAGLGAGALLVPRGVLPAAAEAQRRHALSLVGDLQYGPDFTHFDWADPKAPKGGAVRLRAMGSYDTLNPFAAKGTPASALGLLVYDSLMVSSLDEPSTEYGLVAAWVSYPDDAASATFGLRPEARFADGTPVTAADVIFSLDALKAAGPQYALYYQNVVKAEQTGANEVTFRFDAPGNRELPHIVGQLSVLPRHFWLAKGSNGEPRDLARGTMEVPLGSGPYRIGSFEAGRRITYVRRGDWWARDLPVARGQWNFEEITFLYYRDRTPAFEAFKTGETDFWPEASAKAWATGYDVDAVRSGRIKKEMLPSREMASMQGFAFNVRRRQFQDRRVRRAFNLAFDFELANKTMFYDQYKRTGSYFEGSELAATGLPTGQELEILDSVREAVPPEVFTTPYANPVNTAPDDRRRNMREAARLLAEAGWAMRDGGLFNKAGDRLTAEVLLVQPDFERLVLIWKAELEKLGIRVEVRTVDSAHYTQRIESFDFDIVVSRFAQSHSPGNEQREFWGSAAADKQASRNIIGIKDAAVDKLIDRVIYAPDRKALVAATRALDRVLLWNAYVVPQFHTAGDRIAYWAKFARPARLPQQASALTTFLRVWWWDAAAAGTLGSPVKP